MKIRTKYSNSFIISLIKPLPKFILVLFIFLILHFLISLYVSPSSCDHIHIPALRTSILQPGPSPAKPKPNLDPTELHHVVFGIGAAAKHWPRRKPYVKYWWPGPKVARGFVFFDRLVNLTRPDNPSDYPTLFVSGDTDGFPYTYRRGSRSALRITRIVSELVRMVGSEETRWFVMGDDDTVFFTNNLVRVLRKYDHTKMYYIGSNSETYWQNVNFDFNMAFGGGGFAISYGLAKAIEKMQDRCIRRYGSLYGSDDRIHACLSELGVPLTKEPGFHQCDVYGNLFGLLSAHPIAPIVTLHHLDLLDPIFPYMTRTQALSRLTEPIKLDSAALMQQSICYDTVQNWTVSVSWGYSIQIIRGFVAPREMQRPARTFFNWYKRGDPYGFSFSTRPLKRHPCQKPYIYYVNNTEVISNDTDVTRSVYLQHDVPYDYCWWNIENPDKIRRVEVYKKPNPHKWDRDEAPRRDCCRVQHKDKKDTMVIEVGECREDEVIEPLL